MPKSKSEMNIKRDTNTGEITITTEAGLIYTVFTDISAGTFTLYKNEHRLLVCQDMAVIYAFIGQ